MREGRPDQRGHNRPEDQRSEHMDGRGHCREHHGKKDFNKAQTFRRGRAIAFLDRLNVKRSTLLKQLDQPEYESIKQVISGELKATEAIIQEFIHTFELREAVEEGIINETQKKISGEEEENERN